MTTAWTTDTVTPDPARAVGLTLLWGLDGVALRTVGGGRVPNVTEAPLRRRLAEAELPVVAVDPGLFEGAAGSRAGWLNDLAALDETAAFCVRVGCGLVRVGALALGEANASARLDAAGEALRQAGDHAAGHGLRLAVRNDAQTAVATGAALAALLDAVDHPAVGADWRPADAVLAGESPSDGLAALGRAPLCVGVRDGEPVRDRSAGPSADGLGSGWARAVVGQGGLGWGEQLSALAALGFAGPLVIDEVPHPARSAGLASATALIRAARRAERGA